MSYLVCKKRITLSPKQLSRQSYKYHQFCLADQISQAESMFAYGGPHGRKRRRRQIPGPVMECTSFDNCGDPEFEALEFEDLEFTEEEREFCDNEPTCLYDLHITADEDMATLSKRASEQADRIHQILSM